MSGFPGIQGFYDRQKEIHGRLATFVWIGSGLYLFLSDEGFRSLISFKALVFFVVGMFVAAVLLGSLAYGLQRLAAKALMKFIPKPTSLAASTIRLVGFVLLLVNAAVGFFAAWVVYHHVATWVPLVFDGLPDTGTLLLTLFVILAAAALWYVKRRRST